MVGDGVLLIEDGFDPGAGGFVLHVHQVEYLQADPGTFGEAERVFGLFGQPAFVPDFQGKANVCPVVGLEAVGIAVHPVVVTEAKGQARSDEKGKYCMRESRIEMVYFS